MCLNTYVQQCDNDPRLSTLNGDGTDGGRLGHGHGG